MKYDFIWRQECFLKKRANRMTLGIFQIRLKKNIFKTLWNFYRQTKTAIISLKIPQCGQYAAPYTWYRNHWLFLWGKFQFRKSLFLLPMGGSKKHNSATTYLILMMYKIMFSLIKAYLILKKPTLVIFLWLCLSLIIVQTFWKKGVGLQTQVALSRS